MRDRFRWRRIFSHPRIGGRVTAIRIDPSNPDRIFVGSEEGTVFRSFDGGATWDERVLFPFVTIDRSLGLAAPGLPQLGQSTPPSLQLLVFPPFSTVVGIPTIPYVGYAASMPGAVTDEQTAAGARAGDGSLVTADDGLFGADSVYGSTFPSFMKPFIVSPIYAPPSLLKSVTTSRRAYTDPVKDIAICPGNQYPLLVATRNNLYGSVDDGLTYQRIFAVPGNVQLVWVACDPDHRNHLALATAFGLYRSEDGGLSFDQDTRGWPGAGVTAITYAPGGGFFTANGTVLFHTDPAHPATSVMVYPDFNNSATAPWATIRFIAPTRSGQIWLATDDGVRTSPDGGTNWEVPARTLFASQPIYQIVSGQNAQGQERIAVLVGAGPGAFQGKVMATDDGGQHWFPFFSGLTNRAMMQMATVPSPPGQPPRWWVVGGSEVWATVEPSGRQEEAPGERDPEAAAWARTELSRMPSMYAVLDKALQHTGLRVDLIQHYTDGMSRRAWVPSVAVTFDWQNMRNLGTTDVMQPSNPFQLDNVVDQPEWQIFAQATWYLRDLALIDQQINTFQNETNELRRQITFAAEDAWRERVQHLQRMARGNMTAYQAAVLRTRIETIDAALRIWLGMPVDSLGAR